MKTAQFLLVVFIATTFLASTPARGEENRHGVQEVKSPKREVDPNPTGGQNRGLGYQCPPPGTQINCMPTVVDPQCQPPLRTWIAENCPEVGFID